MRRLLTATFLVALVAGFATSDDKPKPAEPAKDFKALEKEFLGKLKSETDSKERGELLKKYAKTFYQYAEKNPKDAAAFDALVYVLRMTAPSTEKDAPGFKALAVLRQNYAKSDKIVKWLPLFAQRGDDASVAFLKAVMEENPGKKTQAKACKSLAQAREMAVKMAARLKDNDQVKEQLEKARGKEFVKGLLDNVERNTKEAKEYAQLLKGKFAKFFPVLEIGKPAPEAESEDLEGKKVKLADLKGKVVVIDIWATWCGPCRAMIPHTTKLVEKMKDKPFVFVNVSGDDNPKTVREFLKKTPMPWTHWYGANNIVEDWEIQAFPTIYILDHKGVIRYKNLRGEKMDEAVEKLVKECEGEKKPKTE